MFHDACIFKLYVNYSWNRLKIGDGNFITIKALLTSLSNEFLVAVFFSHRNNKWSRKSEKGNIVLNAVA